MGDAGVAMDKGTKKNLTVQKITELIETGGYKEGDRLPSERELAKRINVGRNIVRESIATLEAMGIVEIQGRTGIFLKTLHLGGLRENIENLQFWPTNFVSQILEVRLMVNVPAAEMAALRRTEKDLQDIGVVLKTLQTLHERQSTDYQLSAKWEAAFHALIIRATHNEVLTRIYESLSALENLSSSMNHQMTTLLHSRFSRSGDWLRRISEEHSRLVDAIRRQDAEDAGRIMREHVKGTIECFERESDNDIFVNV